MRIQFLAISLLFISIKGFSQNLEAEIPPSSAPNVFLELGGNGVFLSANYDQRFNKTGKGLGFRAGIGFVPGFGFIVGETSSFLTVPVGINYLVGNGPHHLELGAGATFVTGNVSVFDEEADATGFAFVPSIAYRYQRIGRGFTGRVVVSPFFSGGGGSFYFGLSGGFRLK